MLVFAKMDTSIFYYATYKTYIIMNYKEKLTYRDQTKVVSEDGITFILTVHGEELYRDEKFVKIDYFPEDGSIIGICVNLSSIFIYKGNLEKIIRSPKYALMKYDPKTRVVEITDKKNELKRYDPEVDCIPLKKNLLKKMWAFAS